jgi:serine/threonine protein kinase
LPRSLGQHELLVRLAAGGAANVFLVRDLKAPPPGRLLALKVLLPNLAANEDFLRMFFTEARIATRLKHKNIVRIAGFGRSGGIHCLAMEYVFGASLSQVLRASARARKPLTVGVLLRITAAMCDALHHAHELRDRQGKPMGLVHRDVTPQNILIGFNGVPKLTDFGIAKATNRGWETQAGIVKGKFCYMSPEQALGKKVDRRSDIFCAGIVLWEALTGKELFKGSTPMEVLTAIREQKIVQPSKVVPGLSPIVDPIVMKALNRAPRKRYQTALEMRQDIEDLITRAGVTIDETTIAQEFSEIFGDVIVQRAMALRDAMAGRADLDELSRVLGGQKLLDDHLPDLADDDEYDEDPLGLFAHEYSSSFEERPGPALPAAPDMPFTASFQAPVLPPDDEPASGPVSEPASDPVPAAIEELEELSSMEFEEDSVADDLDEGDLDEWNDHTKMMEPPEDLLQMLADDDATIGMPSAELDSRLSARPAPRIPEPAYSIDDEDEDSSGFDDEKTVDVSEFQRARDRAAAKATAGANGSRTGPNRRPPPPPAPTEARVMSAIPDEPTHMQARSTGGTGGTRRPAPFKRPPPRAPSLDLPDTYPVEGGRGRAPAPGRAVPIRIPTSDLLPLPDARSKAPPSPFDTDRGPVPEPRYDAPLDDDQIGTMASAPELREPSEPRASSPPRPPSPPPTPIRAPSPAHAIPRAPSTMSQRPGAVEPMPSVLPAPPASSAPPPPPRDPVPPLPSARAPSASLDPLPPVPLGSEDELPVPALTPFQPTPLGVPRSESALQALAADLRGDLSADELRALASQPPGPPPELVGDLVGGLAPGAMPPGVTPGAWTSGPASSIPPVPVAPPPAAAPSGDLRMSPITLVLMAAALIAVGVAIGIAVVRLTS